jgi:hypothetical protein
MTLPPFYQRFSAHGKKKASRHPQQAVIRPKERSD